MAGLVFNLLLWGRSILKQSQHFSFYLNSQVSTVMKCYGHQNIGAGGTMPPLS